MDFIKIKNNEPLAQAIERANEICLEPIRCHWDNSLFNRNLKIHENNHTNVDDLRFKLGFDHIELLDSVMEKKQSVNMLDSTGNLETLAMTFLFKISETNINGKIKICSVISEPLHSTYKLHLKNMVVKSVVGLYILEDCYRVHHIIHEFVDASVSLVYRKFTKMVPVYSNVQAKNIKHSLVQYILRNCTKNAIAIIEDKLNSAFNLTSVNISLGNLFNLRDDFRLHAKAMKTAFNILVDDIIDSTNLMIVKEVPTLRIPSISVILNFVKNQKKSFQANRNSLTGFNFLLRRKSVLVSLEKELMILYVPVDFADLNVKYKYWTVKEGDQENRLSDIEEHYKTEGSHLTISILSLGGSKIDVNLLEFRIANLILMDSESQLEIDESLRLWINSVFEFQIVPVIENIFEKYLRITIQDHRFTTFPFEKIT